MALLIDFEKPTELQLQKLWREGLFVFDTSVLLSLHRYRAAVRTDFLKGIDAIRNQIWVPFQVALEYENNRPKVVAEKHRLLEEVKSKVSSIADEVSGQLGKIGALRRHSLVDADDFLRKLREESQAFCRALEELSAAAPGLYDEDPVRRAVEDLFSACIGNPPGSQKEIDAIDEVARKRYAASCPPGYLDQSKENGKEGDAYSFAGLFYQRKNGDLYLWDQIKKKSKIDRAPAVCFITDDQKEDWWWMVESRGKKRMGARPELREEIRRESGVDTFVLYSPESFLEALNRYKQIGIQQDTISEAREVSQETRKASAGRRQFAARARAGVYRWCLANAPNHNVIEEVFPDFVEVDDEGRPIRGIEVVPVASVMPEIDQRIARRLDVLSEFLADNPAAELRILFVFSSPSLMDVSTQQIRSFARLPERVVLCVGYMRGPHYKHVRCFLRADASASVDIG